jgi:zinc/manganese transport system permease protein
MDSWFVLPVLALMAGIVALTPLGAQVLRRGVVFIDLAVAQAAAAAVIWVNAAFHFDTLLIDQAAATGSAVAISLLIAWVARRWHAQREALIGLIYVAGACMALLGASLHPHGKDKLLQLLAADVLWVDASSVIALSLSALVVLLIQRLGHLSKDALFYGVFAVVASVAVPALGLFLVFASLIAPALWIEKGLQPLTAMAIAVFVGIAGLLISWMFDTPSGPTMVLTLSTFGLCALFRRGTMEPESKVVR